MPKRRPPQPDDHKRDFPNQDPPEVHYRTVTANYWVCLRERQPYLDSMKAFTEEELAWLESIEPEVERLVANYYG